MVFPAYLFQRGRSDLNNGPTAREMLAGVHESSPYYDELMFLVEAFEEADQAEFPGREHKTGEHYPEIKEFLAEVRTRLTGIDPEYTPDHLATGLYLDRDLQFKLSLEKGYKRDAIEAVRQQYLEGLLDFGTRQFQTDMTPHDMRLDAPEFLWHGKETDSVESNQGCMNACFRMVFQAVTGQKLNEGLIIKTLKTTHGSHLVHDSTYWKVFNTAAFKNRYPQRPQVISLIGASLMDMAAISGAAKSRIPDVKTYGVVSLLSESANEKEFIEGEEVLTRKNVLHKNILLDSGWVNALGQTRLRVHDPSPLHGGAGRVLKYEDFYPRWAAALNVGHIVINRPVQ